MNFSTDRDLLRLEPNLFHDVPLLSQQRVKVADAVVAGTTLTSAAANFEAADVQGGSVVLIGDVACEVLHRTDPHTLNVSLLRTHLSDDPIPPGDGEGLEAVVRTFAPQAALVHDTLLQLLEIDPDDPSATVTEDDIVSLTVMARLEALGTLERLFGSASALVGNNFELREKARWWGLEFRSARRRAVVQLDADRDGKADQQRRFGVAQLVRR